MEQIRIKLRRAKPTDTRNIMELMSELDRPLPKDSYNNKRFQKLINSYIQTKPHNDSKGIILAKSGQKVIGLVSYVLLVRLNQRLAEFWIPELVVSKEYRRQGIGKLLINRCKVIAKRMKCYRIRLESRNDRIDSHSFYRNIGFQQIALVFEVKL
jgi:ribosomal protein S18 acetylase RimI-like enzyme